MKEDERKLQILMFKKLEPTNILSFTNVTMFLFSLKPLKWRRGKLELGFILFSCSHRLSENVSVCFSINGPKLERCFDLLFNVLLRSDGRTRTRLSAKLEVIGQESASWVTCSFSNINTQTVIYFDFIHRPAATKNHSSTKWGLIRRWN